MNTDRIKPFTQFLKKEVLPGVNDLEKLEDNNRKHVQKLVYTNVVNRFDTFIDKLILDNCREKLLVSKALPKNDQLVKESDMVKRFMETSDIQSTLDHYLQDRLRTAVLRQRHSRKFFLLLTLFDHVGEFEKNPRVNPMTGEIMNSATIQNETTPHSICGYADWLYSRRNALVHGGGSVKFLDNDKRKIKNFYSVDLPETFKISLASIRVATNYYLSVCSLIEQG